MAAICATVFVFIFLQCDANENGLVNLESDLRWQNLLNYPVVNFQTEESNPLGYIPYKLDTIPQMPTVVSSFNNLAWPSRPKPNLIFKRPLFVSPYAVDDNNLPYLIRFNTDESTGNELKWPIDRKSRDKFESYMTLWYPLRSGLLSQLLHAKAFKNAKKNKKLLSNRIRGWWLLKEKPTTGLPPDFTRLQKSRSTPKYLKNILKSIKSKKSLRNDRTQTNRIYSDEYLWPQRIPENNLQTIFLPNDDFGVLNRNFLWLGTPGKPLVLVRSLRPSSILSGNRRWGTEESELSSNNFLLPRKSNNLFPYGAIDPYYNSLDNSLFSRNKHIRKWPNDRIHVTWFAREGVQNVLNRLAATQRTDPRIVTSNKFLEHLLKQDKRKKFAGRLHATWLSDRLQPSFQVERYGLNNLPDNITRYRRSINNKKKRVSNRLKSIWLVTLTPSPALYTNPGRGIVM